MAIHPQLLNILLYSVIFSVPIFLFWKLLLPCLISSLKACQKLERTGLSSPTPDQLVRTESNKRKASAAASSSGDVTLKYDVFLSFSGVDTRKGFTNTLFNKLKDKGIEAFIDDELPRGQQIETSLVKTIKESMIAVVVFSKNYASSSWCLDELVKIREFNLVIMPIFYDVKPDHVRELSGEFGEEFAKLTSTENEVKIKKWSDDLAFASTQSGWDLNNYSKEIDVIEMVTAGILKYLDSVPVSTYLGEFSRYIGIASLIDELKGLLHKESSGVQFYGLWGMGGIGKTTIANALYDQLSPQFDKSYFCSLALDENDVRKLVVSRNKMIFHILNETCDEGAPDQPSARVLSRLRKKKVLIVLDNVSTSDQVTTLVGSKANPWFAFGSKIIVTSRDSQVLKNENMEFREIKEMTKDFSLRLFCLHAFKQNQPLDDEDYVWFSNRMVDYTKGLPLALKVLGRGLFQRTKKEWRSTLKKLETSMDPKIEEVLRISYDNLIKTEKEIFLDIACFFKLFKRYDKDWLEDILDNFDAPIGIAHLIDKCLVIVNPDNTLGMHDLLQQMGQDIVKEESRSGMLKRIWRSVDSYNLLVNYQEAPKTVEGIFLDMDDRGIEKLNIHPRIFSKMQNLRLLIIQYKWGFQSKIKIQIDLNQSWEDFYADGGIQFPNDLRVLCWEKYPGDFLPSNFSAEKLVILDMRWSNLQRLWKEDKKSVNLKSLKVLDLRYSRFLRTLPDLTSAAKLEKIILDGCENLLEIPASIQHLQRLSILSIVFSHSLCYLPSLANISTLRKLDLSRCKSLKVFPETSKEIEELILSETSMVLWPDSMSCLNKLKVLKLPSTLAELPCTLHLNSLEELSFACGDIQVLPKILSRLRKLDLSRTLIKELSSSIVHLSSLIVLNLSYCHLLETLPNNFGQLNYLEELRLSYCEVLLNGPLTLSGLNSIKKLYLDHCKATHFPSWVCTLTSLQLLVLSYNDFVSVPDSITQLSLLRKLYLSDCKHLQSVELPWQTTSSDIADGGKLKPHQFFFAGCASLDEGARRNIVEKTMMRIQHVANKKAEVRIRSLTVSLSGNKIPEFFDDASYATVELPLDFSSSTFGGLVVGFIVSARRSHVDFKCTLKKTDDSDLCSFKKRIYIGGSISSDIMCLHCLPSDYLEALCLHYIPSGVIREYCKDNLNLKDDTHATFSIQLMEVQKCGVHIVYADHEV